MKTNNYSEAIYTDSKWEPFIVEENVAGQVIWLNREKIEAGVFTSGYWKHDVEDLAKELPYHVTGIETMFVIQGEAEVIEPNGNKILLEEGKAYSFTNNFQGTWRTTKSFIKFFVSIK